MKPFGQLLFYTWHIVSQPFDGIARILIFENQECWQQITMHQPLLGVKPYLRHHLRHPCISLMFLPEQRACNRHACWWKKCASSPFIVYLSFQLATRGCPFHFTEMKRYASPLSQASLARHKKLFSLWSHHNSLPLTKMLHPTIGKMIGNRFVWVRVFSRFTKRIKSVASNNLMCELQN